MKHPLAEGTGIKIYVGAWMIIGIIQAFVLQYFYLDSWTLAIWDTSIFNIFFMVIGIGYWYVMKYALPERGDFVGIFSVHLGTATITIGLWIFLSITVLNAINPANDSYLVFLKGSIAWRSILGLFFYTVIMFAFYFTQHLHEVTVREKKELELRSIIRETELRALKSQINPHFIFNSLNSISSLTISAPESAREMVVKLSDFLRYSLQQDDHAENTLEEEINQIDRYLDIEKIRFGDKLVFEKKLNQNTLKLKIPKLILQPVFENAIKYGVYESLDPVTIAIQSKLNAGMLVITVTNGFDPESVAPKGEGIGLKNIKQRLEIRYGVSGLLEYGKTENQFHITMNVPQG